MIAPMASDTAAITCTLCGHVSQSPTGDEMGSVRGNTQRFLDRRFRIWKCPKCLTLHSLDPVVMSDIYREYPPNRRRLDIFAKGTLANLVGRLEKAGLSRNAAILDYGCGNGIFLEFLEQRGYRNVTGYDPYVTEFASLPAAEFDCVVANDVIEHVDDPRAMVSECVGRVRPGGLLYIGTADSEPVDMRDLEPHLMRLHQPFHRIILTVEGLHRLAAETGMDLVGAWRRSYMDTRMPFANYRFLDEFNRALDHNMDRAMDPDAAKVLLRRPSLLFHALFGYFFPSACEPAVLLRKSGPDRGLTR